MAETDPNEIIDVTVRVRHGKGTKSLAGTVATLAATPAHARRHLSREEYTAAHGADHGDLEKVMALCLRARPLGSFRESPGGACIWWVRRMPWPRRSEST